MDEIQLNEIREGTGCPDVEELKPPPLCPGRSDGSVSMETREEEERRWRRRYPEIKKCVILIKKLLKGEKDKMGSRSGDPEVAYDWIEPLRPKVIRRSRVRRFVKRMEFSVNVCNGKPRGRGRGRGLLRLRCCTGEDGVHIGPRQRAKGQVTTKKHKNSINLSETEHNYSNQSHDGRTSTTCGQNDGKSTKKKPPKIVFTKVAEKKWVLGRSKVKQQPEEEEVVGGSGITTENVRRVIVLWSLRKNCGKCPFCLDKKEFGGAARQKQRCINRRCLERLKPKNLPRGMDAEKDVEEETERQKPKNLPRGTEAEKDVDEEVAGKKWVLRRSKVKKQQPEEVKEEVGGSGITTINKRKKRQNSCGQCVACLRENCGKCPFCLDKKEFGGAERRRQRCINRRCLVSLRPHPPDSAHW
ncbi:uncharacterized protein LOC115422037 [Sphaeramia orbicularis]|uniref:uncharacterized protein LOC115422037 n=1 Tax=Sphaeramia orbicularis TaxID=375764 RepID=UPI001180C1BA|nr:uncharacterized protein LOC115422037 [Sphaeramia orbicularis]